MKILHTVQRYAPDTGGSEEVVRKLSEYLVSFGHEVTVATGRSAAREFKTLNGVKLAEFDCLGNSVDGLRGDEATYRRFVKSSDSDLMMNYAAQIWSTDLVFDILAELRMKKVLVPCGYSRLGDPLFAEYFKRLPSILHRYDAVVYLSANYIDAKFGRDRGLTNEIVIPNAADLGEFHSPARGAFRQRHSLGQAPIILNVSNHSTLKGHGFYWNCIAMLKKTTVMPVLIGNSYAPFPKKWLSQCYTRCRLNSIRHKALMLENYPRDQVVEAFVDADVFLFGSEVECSPLVMFEAFAGKALFVTTDCGNVKDYEDVVCIVHNERDAVDVITEFCAHPERYRDRIERGYQYFLESLNWEAVARRYEQLYLGLVRHGTIDSTTYSAREI